jgi:antitoxin ParD1/3/4
MTLSSISLDADAMACAEAQACAAGLADASAYVRELVRRDQERAAAREELQAAITDGMASGISTRSPAELLAMARRLASQVADAQVITRPALNTGK